MHRLHSIAREAPNGVDFAEKYTSYISTLLSGIDRNSINAVIEVFREARDRQSSIFMAGNGGSAATASHFAEDLALGVGKTGNRPFRAVSLTDNSAFITAIGNDDGYENVFVRQLELLYRPGDVVVGISASGKSENVIRALDYANRNGGVTVGLVGFDGGVMKDTCRHTIHVPTRSGEYEPVEDIHLIICHLIASYFKYQPGQGHAADSK